MLELIQMSGLTVLEPGIGEILAASSSGEDGAWWLWLLGVGSAIIFYTAIYTRYRNTDKRHAFEREVHTEMRDLQVYDEFTRKNNGTSNPKTDGANSDKPLRRLGGASTVTDNS